MKRSTRIIILLTTACFLFMHAGTAFGITVKQYKEAMNDEDTSIIAKLYVKGVGEGYSYANGYLESEKKSPMFCVPDDRALNEKDYIDILQSAVKGKDTPGDLEIQAILLYSLIKTFPCK